MTTTQLPLTCVGRFNPESKHHHGKLGILINLHPDEIDPETAIPALIEAHHGMLFAGFQSLGSDTEKFIRDSGGKAILWYVDNGSELPFPTYWPVWQE
jgi:hypothetical protein